MKSIAPCPRPRGNTAFTLVEMMVTFVILVLVLTAIYGVLISALRAQDAIDRTLGSLSVGPAILHRIEEDLRHMAVLQGGARYFRGLDRSFGYADSDRVDFVSSRPARDPETDLLHPIGEVGYQASDNPSEPDAFILYRRVNAGIDETPLSGGDLQELYDRVTSFNVEYFDPQKVDYDDEDWVPEWKEGGHPQAVRITLKIRLGKATRDDPTPKEETYRLTAPLR